MTQLRGVFASLLIGCLFARVVAAEDPAVLLAAKDVVNANSRGGLICKGIAPDPSRADRTKLAKLITALPDPNVRYAFGYADTTPLGLAVLADDVELLDRLFANGARWRSDTFDSEVMYEAARYGSPAMIKALIRHGLSPDARPPASWTGLMAAAWENRLDNVAVLLEAGADAKVALPNGISALGGAVMCRNQAMVDVLVRHGAQPDAKIKRLARDRGIQFPGS